VQNILESNKQVQNFNPGQPRNQHALGSTTCSCHSNMSVPFSVI